MQTKAEIKLNPLKYYLSPGAKKRLKWMYIIHYECGGNISQAANKIGISRTWLSLVHSQWQSSRQDPRSLEPNSRAPHNTDNRQRIDPAVENKILAVRKQYPYWGKEKIKRILKRDYGIQVGASTVNRYLDKHGLINVRISRQNKLAYRNKTSQLTKQKQKYRPPTKIKDYKPGALAEKDLKFVLKMGQFINPEKYRAKENFWYQFTVTDSFTRIRTIGLAEDYSGRIAVAVQKDTARRMPFPIACLNTDSGGENEKEFSQYLQAHNIVHFYSRTGTPTDNPRVERSHLTDEVEFYRQGNVCKTFAEQKQKCLEWEHTYNYVRPHQALGYLTPMEFYELWKKDQGQAFKIVEQWQAYLKRQSQRLATARKMKNQQKINELMEQIDKKLANNYK